MFLASRNIVLSRPLVSSLLGALDVVPGAALLVTPFVHLYTAGPTPITPESVPGDFTEATFVGYAADSLALPLVGPINLADSTLGVTNQVAFLGGAIVSPGEMILGYWIDEAAVGGGDLYLAETFEVPVPFASVGDSLQLDVIAALRQILGIAS